jgi:IS1 family transposase
MNKHILGPRGNNTLQTLMSRLEEKTLSLSCHDILEGKVC